MIALSIMINGIAYSGVVQIVSKLACTIFVKNSLRQIRLVLINSSTCSKAFSDFGYFLCVKKPLKYLYRNAYHKLCKLIRCAHYVG